MRRPSVDEGPTAWRHRREDTFAATNLLRPDAPARMGGSRRSRAHDHALVSALTGRPTKRLLRVGRELTDLLRKVAPQAGLQCLDRRRVRVYPRRTIRPAQELIGFRIV